MTNKVERGKTNPAKPANPAGGLSWPTVMRARDYRDPLEAMCEEETDREVEALLRQARTAKDRETRDILRREARRVRAEGRAERIKR